jgi:hypothetical protein
LPDTITSAAPTRRSLFGPGWLKIPLWALFVVPWIWPGVVVHYRQYRLYQFHEHGVRAPAVVLGKHPEDHYSISFRTASGQADMRVWGPPRRAGPLNWLH